MALVSKGMAAIRGGGRLLVATLVLVPCTASPQGGNPLGPEFRVNTYTTSYQSWPAVASDSSGNFVVVWHSDTQDGSGFGIFGQRFDSTGATLGPEFRINAYTTNNQQHPAAGVDASGNFVVVWDRFVLASPFFDDDVVGQRFANNGAPLGPEFRVNTHSLDVQAFPAVTSDPSGNFVVVWESNYQDGSFSDVFGQRFASTGAPLGSEFRVNTYTPYQQVHPVVTSDTSGNFVVVWDTVVVPSLDRDIVGQRYASTGAPLGPEFRVNTYTTSIQVSPAVASDSSGDFVVVWMSLTQDGSNWGVFGQRYASTGAPRGPEFRVNSYATGDQRYPAVASDPSGNMVVLWSSFAQDGLDYGVFGQRYASTGEPLGTEFRINTYTTDFQGVAAVSPDPSGDFVVVWTSNTQDGSSGGVFGQRYRAIVPVELMRFGVE